MDQEEKKAGHDARIARIWLDLECEKLVKQAAAGAQARAETFRQEAAETDQALKWREQKNREGGALSQG